MTDDPSMAELVRRIEEVVRTQERLSFTLESSYVRKEVYEARHEALRREYDEVNLAFRRQILAGVIVGIVLIVAQIIVVLSRIPGGTS
jgi:hypothetical protein